MNLVGNVTSKQQLHGNLDIKHGVDGMSAYEVAVANGFEGTEEEWLKSLKGDIPDMSEYVKYTNYPTDSKAGVIRVSPYRGLRMMTGGMLTLVQPEDSWIQKRNSGGDVQQTTAITLSKFDHALKQALTDEQLVLTDEEKASARDVLGASSYIITSASGEIVTTTDSAKAKPKNITLFGKSKQDGIPSMETPIIPVHHGESGSIGGKVFCKNLYCGRYYYSQYTGGKGVILNDDEVVLPYDAPIETKGVSKIIPCCAGKTYTMSVRGVNANCSFGITEYADIESAFSTSNVIDYADYSTKTKSYTAKQNGILLCGVAGKWTDGVTTIHVCTEDEEVQVEIGEVATEYEEPVDVQEFTVLTPNGLRGIPLGQTIPDKVKNSPIHMNGVYWDNAEGQYYIGDTKNENGKDVQRIQEIIVTSCYSFNEINDVTVKVMGYLSGGTYRTLLVQSAFCDKMLLGYHNDDKEHFYFYNNSGIFPLWINRSRLESEDLDGVNKFLSNNPLKVTFVLAEPIVTETDVQHDVVMNYPNTTIVDDAGAYMEVEYVADTKCYIDNKFKEMTSAIAQLL